MIQTLTNVRIKYNYYRFFVIIVLIYFINVSIKYFISRSEFENQIIMIMYVRLICFDYYIFDRRHLQSIKHSLHHKTHKFTERLD